MMAAAPKLGDLAGVLTVFAAVLTVGTVRGDLTTTGGMCALHVGHVLPPGWIVDPTRRELARPFAYVLRHSGNEGPAVEVLY